MLDEEQLKELSNINKEIASISNDLERISSNVRNDFSGIGNERCADCLSYTSRRILEVYKLIANTDQDNLSDEYKHAQEK